MIERIRENFMNLTLSQRFMLASLVILLAGMLGIGAWVEHQIVTGVIHRTGATTALYVDSFVAPKLQELGQSDSLSPVHAEELSRLLQTTPMGQQIVAFKVWNTRGRLLYSNDSAIIGRSFPMNESMLRARLGNVMATISSLDDEENIALGAKHDHLLEIYSPVWLSGTNEIIAIAEFYQITTELDHEIGVLKRTSWLVVGLAILIIYLLLSGFVRRASDTITQQQSELSRKVDQLTELLAQNHELNERVRRAAGSVALLNEGYLRRVGAELHDGPAQDLGLSLLKLDALQEQLEKHPQAQSNPALVDSFGAIQVSLQHAMREMRAIAGGLSLPQLTDLNLAETVTRVVRNHERRTGTQVSLNLEGVPDHVPAPLKITTYRLIQEALNNAFRHAGGAGQRVKVCLEQATLVVEVSDSGPGFSLEVAGAWSGRLGISGMCERVESIGGFFKIESQAGQGTRIIARMPYLEEGIAPG